MSTVLRFDVRGTPGAQGSKRHIGRGRLLEQSKRVAPWRADVQGAALAAMAVWAHKERTRFHPIGDPVDVSIDFRFRRPKSHFGSGRNADLLKDGVAAYPVSRNLGDLDKLVRSTLDALTAAAVFVDDSLVVRLDVWKLWCVGDEVPGASIRVRTVVPQ